MICNTYQIGGWNLLRSWDSCTSARQSASNVGESRHGTFIERSECHSVHKLLCYTRRNLKMTLDMCDLKAADIHRVQYGLRCGFCTSSSPMETSGTSYMMYVLTFLTSLIVYPVLTASLCQRFHKIWFVVRKISTTTSSHHCNAR